jgi:hypothetical protein
MKAAAQKQGKEKNSVVSKLFQILPFKKQKAVTIITAFCCQQFSKIVYQNIMPSHDSCICKSHIMQSLG